MTTPVQTTCNTCHYYRNGANCHRYPDIKKKIGSDWCGEWVVDKELRTEDAGVSFIERAFGIGGDK